MPSQRSKEQILHNVVLLFCQPFGVPLVFLISVIAVSIIFCLFGMLIGIHYQSAQIQPLIFIVKICKLLRLPRYLDMVIGIFFYPHRIR